MANTYTNILIIKPSALGDIVHALPVLSALRTELPQSRITWLINRQFAPLLECIDGLDDILLFDRKQLGHWYYRPAAGKALWTFLRTLRHNRYDLVLDLQGLFRTAFFARVTGCPLRIGMAEARECAGWFYTRKVPRPNDSLHVLDYYYALLEEIGIASASAGKIAFNIPDDAAAAAAQKLKQAGVTGKYGVLVPGSAHPDKCWPADRFAALAEKLHDQYGCQIAAVGTLHDKSAVQNIQKHCRLPIADLIGQTSIKELIAIFARAAAVVSNDTGPGHIAVETGVPTVIIYGNVNPQRVAPYRRPECIAAIDPDRRPAGIRTADPAHDIKNVTFEIVWEKLNALLADNPINQTWKP